MINLIKLCIFLINHYIINLDLQYYYEHNYYHKFITVNFNQIIHVHGNLANND